MTQPPAQTPPSAASLLQTLVRFDTTNPPGNEGAAIRWVKELLASVGISSMVLENQSGRGNLIARFPGRGTAPPLMIYGHLDVVTVAGQQWQHDPFSGLELNGDLWGRGALDMKGGVAIFLAALLRAHLEQIPLPRDILLVLVSDEENGGDHGAGFLVRQHKDLFQGIRHALGEFGGFSYHLAGQRFYPIMVSEKQLCVLKAIIRGPGGHGSLTSKGGTIFQLSKFLARLDQKQLPVHITEPARSMVQGISAALPFPASGMLRQLLNPRLTDRILGLLGTAGSNFSPLFHNTANPTILRGGEKINVIPSEIHIGMDGRLLPGFKPETLLQEIRKLTGQEVELTVERYDPGPEQIDWCLYPSLQRLLKQADPGGEPIPLLLSGVTDGRYFSQLGIQTYGFIPMKLPKDFQFARTIHAADERIPVSALEFGCNVIFQTIQQLV